MSMHLPQVQCRVLLVPSPPPLPVLRVVDVQQVRVEGDCCWGIRLPLHTGCLSLCDCDCGIRVLVQYLDDHKVRAIICGYHLHFIPVSVKDHIFG